MRFMMMGSGGVGGYFGARLAAAGRPVTFVARGPHLDALRGGGLRVESPRGDVRLKTVRAVDDPGAAGPVDVIFVAVKLNDLDGAIARIAPVLGPTTTVISLQNGIEAADRLVAAFGPSRVAGGVVYIASELAAPGVVRHVGANHRVEIGILPGGETAPVDAIVAALAESGVDAERPADIRLAIWRKFVFLVALSATTTLTGQAIGAIRADGAGRAMFAELMAEAAAVGRAHGIALAADLVQDRLAFVDTLPAAMRSSMAIDAERGKPLELEWLSGAVVRLGAALGVPTPVNDAAYGALRRRAGGRDRP